MSFDEVVDLLSRLLEAVGVAIIVVGTLSILILFLRRWRTDDLKVIFTQCRHWVARTVLLGLEFLVAADIIRTVGVTPNLQSVGVLAIIVAIRTVLSIELEMEIEGRWPWQKSAAAMSKQGSISQSTSGASERSPMSK